ncbi:MAG: CBS domain-containing protein [Kiritimatiellaeota bacterium]|nr:CBS domain-containing protein [Kiritimatiellota bacterium]
MTHPNALPILFIIGAAILGGSLGARLFQRLRIPQVVGYIVVGLVVGKSGLHLITDVQIHALAPFNYFALGVIGFMIGGELHRNVFKKYGRQFMVILFAEGIGAFAMVGLGVGAFTYLLTGDAANSVAFGLVLGAIASATAPAATVDVLWEYKTRGILTTTVLAIVALDDGLGLVLYSLASSVALHLTGLESGSGLGSLLRALYEIGGAVLLGAVAGTLLSWSLRRVNEYGRTLASIIGLLTLVLGVSLWMDVDVILAAMALGVTMVNLMPQRSREAFNIVERFAPPIYVLFFVLVGARLSIQGLPGWMWGLALTYVVGRTLGKMSGAWFGARWTHSADAIRKYLGLCLFSQAGVAIGLSILAGIRFSGHDLYGGVDMGTVILMVVTATTFLVQIIGPPCVKIAVKKAGEIGLNVTEEDLVKTLTVADAMERSTPAFRVDTPVETILSTVAESNASAYAVLDREGRVAGTLTVEELRTLFADPAMGEWLVAFDLMRPLAETVTGGTSLLEARTKLRQMDVESLPVISEEDGTLLGMIDRRGIQRMISRELLRRHQAAGDSLDGATAEGESA